MNDAHTHCFVKNTFNTVYRVTFCTNRLSLHKHVCCWDEFIAGASCCKCNLIPSALLLLASTTVGEGRRLRVQQHGSACCGDLRIVHETLTVVRLINHTGPLCMCFQTHARTHTPNDKLPNMFPTTTGLQSGGERHIAPRK